MNRKSRKHVIENVPYRASEELYQALFEQAADGIFIADEQGHCVEVNQHGCNMLGYTREELLGVAMDDLVTAKDLAHDPLQLDTMRAGTTLLKERRFRCKDGRFLPVEISARMLADGRFLSIVRDVSRRQQVEDQLRESNERFRLLAESSLTGIYLIQDNRFRYVNPAMARIFGYEVEEIIDKLGPMDMVYADDRPLVAENVRRRVEGEEEAIHYEFRGLRQDGTVIDIEVYGRRIEHEGKAGVIGTLVDITERKRTDKALRRNREAEIQFSEQLATLQEITNQLSKAESSDDLYRQAVQLGRSRLGFDRVSIWFIEERLGIMQGSFGINEQGQLRDERQAQVEFRPEGLAWQVFSQKEPTALVEHNSLRDHLGQEVGEGDSAMAALWDGDEVVGVISVDNLFNRQPIRGRRLEILRLYATTLGHLITRKRAEEARRTSEARFRTFVDHAADAFFLHDDDEWGTVLDVNRQACESLGYSRQELIGMTPHDIDAGLDHAYIDQMRARLEAGEVIAADTWHRRKDGSVFPVEVRTRPFWQDERLFAVSLARDVTERRQMEDALKERERHSQSLLRLSRKLEQAQTYDDVLNAAQNEVRSIVGYQNLWAYLFTPDKKQAKILHAKGPMSDMVMSQEGIATITIEGDRMMEEFLDTKEIQVIADAQIDERTDKKIAAKLGNRTLIHVPILLFDRLMGSVGVGTFGDEGVLIPSAMQREYLMALASHMAVTFDRIYQLDRRKQMEQELIEREHEFRTLAENSPDSIARYDVNCRTLYVNPTLEKTLGRPASEMLGTTPVEAALIGEFKEYQEKISEVLETGKQAEMDIIMPDRGKGVRYHNIRFVAERRADGTITGVQTIGRDITERKQAEDEHQGHLRFLESLDQVNRAIQGAHDLEQMMSDVLDVVLDMFGCERSNLVFPCDPEAATWQVSMERARPEYPSILELGQAMPIDSEVAELFGILLEASAPVRFGPQSKHSLLSNAGEGYDIKSFLGMALYPKVGSPWLFGLHQCSYPRVWTPEEERLLQEIGRRLTDSLTSLLAYRNLQESEERYRLIAENTADTISIFDLNLKPIYVSPSVLKLRGFTAEEAMSQSLDQVLTPESLQKAKEVLAEQMALEAGGKADPARTVSLELEQYRKDGSIIWVEMVASALRDKDLQPTSILTVSRDITDRKQAEIERERLLAQIQEQAQQVQNIIDTVPEGVVLLSKEQFVTLTNPVAEQVLTLLAPGWENGRLTHLGQRPLPELLTSPPKGLWHEITSGEIVFETIARPVENGPENGGWVLVLRDITQERNIQRRVQQQDRLAAVGQLAAGIAHDFNNILAVVTLYVELIARTTQMPARTQEQLQMVEQQIRRAADLIRQILDFSRQSVLDRQPLDLLPFVEKLVTLLERALPEHIRIELDCAADAYFVQADPTRMQQVIMNLAVNARDAMPDGGQLHIRLAHVRTDESKPMTIQELPPGDWIQVEVTDTGSGIPPEAFSNIFEPFFTTKKEGQGTGLGLAQVYGIIQQHGGYIDVVTEVGKGTSFFLYFPAFNTGENAMGAPDKSDLQLGQGQKVLLVEDNPATREAMLDSLILLDYEVITATNGREALAILAAKANGVDLVLSDVVMPEMGGIALFHAMQEKNPTMPMVLLTGHPLTKEMENLQALGLAGWLPKPPDLVNMSHLLAKVLAVYNS